MVYTDIRIGPDVVWLARGLVLFFAVLHRLSQLALCYCLSEHFLFSAVGHCIGLRLLCRLLLVCLALWVLLGCWHIDVLCGNLRRLGICRRSSISALSPAPGVSCLSPLVALNAKAQHHDHANEGNHADRHPDVLPNLIRERLHGSVDIESQCDSVVGVVVGGDVLAQERVAQDGEVSRSCWDVRDCHHAGRRLVGVS